MRHPRTVARTLRASIVCAAMAAALAARASAAAATWTSVDLDEATHGRTSPAHGPAEGSVSLTSQGRDLWNHENDVRFCYREVRGDFVVTCRIASMTNSHEWAKAGILVRGHPTAPHARQVWMARTPGHRQQFGWNPDDRPDGYSHVWAPGPGGPGPMPCWLRLERRGDTFTGYYAPDAHGSPSPWVLHGSAIVPMQDRVSLGLLVLSHDPEAPCTAAFDHVEVAAGAPPPGATATACYFDNQTLAGPPALVRQEAAVCLARGDPGRIISVSPIPGVIGAEHISARWTGIIRCHVDGGYLFDALTDDGARLWIDDKQVIDSWEIQAPRHQLGAIHLTRGLHTLKLEWFQNLGAAAQQLRWRKPGASALEFVTFASPAAAAEAPAVRAGKKAK